MISLLLGYCRSTARWSWRTRYQLEIGGQLCYGTYANDTLLFIRLTVVGRITLSIPRIAIASIEGPS